MNNYQLKGKGENQEENMTKKMKENQPFVKILVCFSAYLQ